MKAKQILQVVLAGWLVLVTLIGVVPPVAAQATPADAVAAILILDVSGSNRTTDPGNLRFTDAALFASLLDEGDALGLIAFATTSRPLTAGLVQIRSAADKLALVAALAPLPADGWTDFKAAFAEAGAMLRGADLAGRRAVVICLTDGKPEISQPYAAYEEEALAQARSLGVPVLAIALTPQALSPFLGRLAAETGGAVIPADQADDLLDAYLAVFSGIKDRTVLGADVRMAPGAAPLPLDPALMPYVERVSFVSVQPAAVHAQLLAPNGQVVDAGSPGVSFVMAANPQFTVVTVDRPAAGEWRFRLQGSGAVQARVVLRSRLRVEVAAPGTLHEAGQPMPVVVRLIEEKNDGRTVKVIGEASFSALITRPDGRQESLDRFYDDGTHGDARADDGDFTRLYVNADRPGSYTILVRGAKGLVPVEQTARVQAIAFPALVADGLAGAVFEVRGQPMMIGAGLEGGTYGQFDGGSLIARITAPGGQAEEIELRWDGSRYSGRYLPRQDGVYQVDFTPRGATYQGLPYGHTASARFEARIVPAVTIGAAALELGAVEMAAARQGVTLTIPVTSTSRQLEQVQVSLAGMAGWILPGGATVSIPTGSSRLALSLRATDSVAPGPIGGQLSLAARAGVDLLGGNVPLRGELYQPALTLQPAAIDLGSAATCTGWSEGVPVTIESSGRGPEVVRLRLAGLPGARIEPETLAVQPGRSRVTLAVLPEGTLAPGHYTARLLLEGRSGLNLPVETLIAFDVAPLAVRCKGQIAGASGALLALFGGVLLAARRARAAIRLPLVTGTLRHWPVGRPGETADVDLTALQRSRIVVGSGTGCDVVIRDPALGEEACALAAERADGETRIVLHPIGEVRRGYRAVADAVALGHKDTFVIGNREYQYLSDQGL